MEKGLISVIVPIYNVEEYLPKCIESIINQTYNNLEIILVDDGSPDNCGKICDEYAKKDSRIKVIHKENGGLSDARNVGLDIAKGEYISFVDSDDYISHEMIFKLYASLKEHDSDISICDFCRVTKDKILDKCGGEDNVCTSYEALDRLQGSNRCYYSVMWNKVYKKDIFKHIRFPVGKINEDEFVIHHILKNCNRISCNSDVLYYYFMRENSITKTVVEIKTLDMAEAFFDRVSFALKNNIDSLAVKASIDFIGRMRYCLVNMNEKKSEIIDRLKQLKKMYNKIYFKIITKKASVKNKMVFTLFFINMSLYNSLVNFIKLRSKNEQK